MNEKGKEGRGKRRQEKVEGRKSGKKEKGKIRKLIIQTLSSLI
jgi:hypothetical protein